MSIDPRVGKICRPKPEIAERFTESAYVIRQILPQIGPDFFCVPELLIIESPRGKWLVPVSEWLVPEMELVPA
jgi:hypothetical protein